MVWKKNIEATDAPRTPPTTLGTGLLVHPTTTRTTAMLSFPSSLVTQECVTLDDVFDAYFDCRKHKRSKRSSVEYELNYEVNNLKLYEDLNNRTYKPTTSIAFCVTKPKLREVFAADFRDRIVHHLFIKKIGLAVERRLNPHIYACRECMGTVYGIRDVARAMVPGKWYAKCDIKSFFMSINKDILLRLVNEVVLESCTENVDWWLWLAKTIVMHRPEQDCELHGDVGLFRMLPKSKSLFMTNGCGMPIGNLTSQILAGLYLADFDKCINDVLGEEGFMGRYSDDFIMIHPDRKVIHKAVSVAREYLREERALTLHPQKIAIQRTERGVGFTGSFIKGGIILPKHRLSNNALSIAEKWSEKEKHTQGEREVLRSRYNSYCGLLLPFKSYKLRKKMWRTLGDYEHINLLNNKKIIITKS